MGSLGNFFRVAQIGFRNVSFASVRPADHHLYTVTDDRQSIELVVTDTHVIAAQRPIAAWALRRTLADVTAFAALHGASVTLVDPAVAPAPAGRSA
jgi:hypothetical protein